MKALAKLTTGDIDGGINLIDLGASGKIPDYWKPIAHLVNLIGFDPNEEECNRLNQTVAGFASSRFLPYAIAGETRQFTLYKTNSIYCWSLLRPDLQWLRRFAYSDLFELTGTETITAYALKDVPEIEGLDLDALKLDTQGLELPILESARDLIGRCIYIETETGFTHNYENETTFLEVGKLMADLGFGLYSLNPNHRVAKKNSLSTKSTQEQMLWCEAVWLRDFKQMEPRQVSGFTAGKALKALCFYANHGCIASGLDAAACFRDAGVITGAEFDQLAQDLSFWRLPRLTKTERVIRSVAVRVPRRWLTRWTDFLLEVQQLPNPLRRSR
jgi:hypothetical protein